MKEVLIDTERIAEYLYNKLIKKGFVPTNEETLAIADIMFDYLVEMDVITEIEGYRNDYCI